MKSFRIIFIIYLLVQLLTACVTEKRLHNRGYHVRWNSGKNFSTYSEKDRAETEKPEVDMVDTLSTTSTESEKHL